MNYWSVAILAQAFWLKTSKSSRSGLLGAGGCPLKAIVFQRIGRETTKEFLACRRVVIGGVGLGVVGVVSFSSAAIFALPCPLRSLANFDFRRTPLGPQGPGGLFGLSLFLIRSHLCIALSTSLARQFCLP